MRNILLPASIILSFLLKSNSDLTLYFYITFSLLSNWSYCPLIPLLHSFLSYHLNIFYRDLIVKDGKKKLLLPELWERRREGKGCPRDVIPKPTNLEFWSEWYLLKGLYVSSWVKNGHLQSCQCKWYVSRCGFGKEGIWPPSRPLIASF